MRGRRNFVPEPPGSLQPPRIPSYLAPPQGRRPIRSPNGTANQERPPYVSFLCIPFIAARFNDVFGEPFGDEHMKNLKEAAKSENPEPKPLDIPKMWDDLSLEQRNEIIELVKSKTKK